MRNRKVLNALIGVFIVVVSGLVINGIYGAWNASPKKEYIKIGNREIILGDDGDSPVGRRIPGAGSNRNKGLSLEPILSGTTGDVRKLSLAYTCVGDKMLFDSIFPAFQKYWLEKTGEKVNFNTGWALPDFDKVATTVSGEPVQVLIMTTASNQLMRGYTETKWQLTPNKGIVYSYPQVFLVRKGNPKKIKTYADLAIPGLRVLHSDPLKGTGGGLWQIYGIYGSALKETEVTQGNKDRKLAAERLRQVEENAFYGMTVQALAMQHFLQGAGDVIIAPEFSALAAAQKDDSVEVVIPPYTVIADLAVFKMEKNISKNDRELVEEFIDFLFREESQESIADNNFRPSDPAVLANHPEFKPLDNPFHLDYIGESTKLKKDVILGKWLEINNTRGNNVVKQTGP